MDQRIDKFDPDHADEGTVATLRPPKPMKRSSSPEEHQKKEEARKEELANWEGEGGHLAPPIGNGKR